MSLELHFITKDPAAVAAYDQVMTARDRFVDETLALVKSWGFDAYEGTEFHAPESFLLKVDDEAETQKPAPDGFKGGESTWSDKQRYQRFTIYGKHAQAKVRRTELIDIVKRHTVNGITAERASRQICKRLNVNHEVISGNKLMRSTVFKLNTGELLLQYPIVEDSKTSLYVTPELESHWKEILPSEAARRINKHNKWARG